MIVHVAAAVHGVIVGTVEIVGITGDVKVVRVKRVVLREISTPISVVDSAVDVALLHHKQPIWQFMFGLFI
jgi:hypothetical protein